MQKAIEPLPLPLRIADQILKSAEARFLRAHGWVTVKGKGTEGEQLWTYNGTLFAKIAERRRWRNIDQSHAINAQKKALRTKGALEFFPVKEDTEG